MNKSDVVAAVCAALFVVVLAVSAYWEPGIRVLHTVEALPYLLAGILALRRSKFGYALGVSGGGFWLLMASWRSSFVRNGFERLFANDWSRPNLTIAVPAAIATGGLAFFSLIGYAQVRDKSWRDALTFGAALALIPLSFIGIFAAFAPRYLGMFRSR